MQLNWFILKRKGGDGDLSSLCRIESACMK